MQSGFNIIISSILGTKSSSLVEPIQDEAFVSGEGVCWSEHDPEKNYNTLNTIKMNVFLYKIKNN